MKVPLKVTLRHMDPSPALEEAIRERAGKLDEVHRLVRCEVLVESPHNHNRNGRAWVARLTLTVRGAEPVVMHEPDEDPYVAVRRAFAAARRRLDARTSRRRARRAARAF